jgi:cell volume regulation protein A
METNTALISAKHILLLIGLMLAAGAVCGYISQKVKVPDIVMFLLTGILLGPQYIGAVDVQADSVLYQIVLIFGSCYILFDGGASLRFMVLRKVWITIVAIATVGVLITCAITGLTAYYVFDIPLIVALLLGATIASTDPATLVPIFKQIRIRERVSQAIMSESAFNDAMAAVITFAILAVAAGKSEFSVQSSLFFLLKESIVGIFTGAVLGYAAAWLIAHEKYAFLAEYAPVVTLMAVIGAYLSADGLHSSGFMAVFAFGIVLGNKDAFGFRVENGENEKLEEFILTTSFIMRMFIFILLGSQVNFSQMSKYVGGGIIVVTIFMLVARPVTVFLCALPDRRAKWTLNELLFMCWTRETGVIPAALAGLLAGMKAPGAELISSVTFIAIMMTILIQATTTKLLAGRLGLLVEEQ